MTSGAIKIEIARRKVMCIDPIVDALCASIGIKKTNGRTNIEITWKMMCMGLNKLERR